MLMHVLFILLLMHVILTFQPIHILFHHFDMGSITDLILFVWIMVLMVVGVYKKSVDQSIRSNPRILIRFEGQRIGDRLKIV